jgi:hypothetical protein
MTRAQSVSNGISSSHRPYCTSRREQDAHSRVLSTSPHDCIARVQLQQNKQATQNPTTLSATAAHPTASPLPRRTTHSPPPAPRRHLTQHLSLPRQQDSRPQASACSPPIARLPHKPPRAPPRKSRSAPIARAHDLEQDPSHRPRNLPEQKGQAAAVARTPAAAEASPDGAVLCISRPSERASDVQAGKRTTSTWRSRGGS